MSVPLTLWPSQEMAVEAVKAADADGFRDPICVTAPTGGGKTLTMATLAAWANARCWRVGLFTNRKLLTSQASETLQSLSIGHGIIAGDHEQRLMKWTQVCSFQALGSRVLNRETVELPKFRLALIDEAHSNKGSIASEIIRRLQALGCLVVGFTATPVNVGHIYKRLVVAGTKSELRARGALVPCRVFAPDEPDLKGVTRTKVGEYEYKGQVKRLMQTLVFANVIEQWKKLNPDGKPTLQWAPGVKESRWFEEEWKKAGVTARHIDASTPDSERQDIIGESKDGKVQVITSQGIMREGVDLPWICHGILTQPCNNLSTYLQIVGRLLRACPDAGKKEATLQDHAGAFWRHGSPNEDREWSLNETDDSIAFDRKQKFEQGEMPEPIRCPECGGVRKVGAACPYCGHKHKQSVRMVRMTTGELVAVRGNVHKKKQKRDPKEKAWISTLCACARGSKPRTVGEAATWFRRQQGEAPRQGMKFVPESGSPDWNRMVADVFPWAAGKKKLEIDAAKLRKSKVASFNKQGLTAGEIAKLLGVTNNRVATDLCDLGLPDISTLRKKKQLSERLDEVRRLHGECSSNNEIARRANIKPGAVGWYLKKLGLSSRYHAIAGTALQRKHRVSELLGAGYRAAAIADSIGESISKIKNDIAYIRRHQKHHHQEQLGQ